MPTSWIKITAALAATAVLGGLLYFLYQSSRDSSAPAVPDAEALERLRESIGEIDFYKFLPEGEEAVVLNPSAPADEAPRIDEVAGIVFQVGAYRDKGIAERQRAELALLNLRARIEPTEIDDERWYRLRIGPVEDTQEFERVRARLAQSQIDYFLSRAKSR